MDQGGGFRKVVTVTSRTVLGNLMVPAFSLSCGVRNIHNGKVATTFLQCHIDRTAESLLHDNHLVCQTDFLFFFPPLFSPLNGNKNKDQPNALFWLNKTKGEMFHLGKGREWNWIHRTAKACLTYRNNSHF